MTEGRRGKREGGLIDSTTMSTFSAVVAAAFALAVVIAASAASAESLVDDLPADADIRFKNRDLLQESEDDRDEKEDEGDRDEDKGDRGDRDEKEDGGDRDEEKEKEEKFVPERAYGPDVFFDKGNFYLSVREAIILHILDGRNNGSKLDTVKLDTKAESVEGSWMNPDRTRYMETLTWKSIGLRGEKGTVVTTVGITMTFDKTRKEFKLTGLAVAQLDVDRDFLSEIVLKTKTTKGYDVSAPIGLSYCCTKSPGMFAPDLGDEANRDRKFLAGLTFPEIRLQVFEVYTLEPGNRWTCGSFIGIGLWVGILVSLFFALVCYWGFTMLASIHTMDRFDDPKGKPIHVPATE